MCVAYIVEYSTMPGVWEVYRPFYFLTMKEAQAEADKLTESIKKSKSKWNIRVSALLPKGDEYETEVQHAMSMMCDCVPYDDPDYHSKLRNMAEGYVKSVHDPNSQYNKMCEEHDRLLAEGKIDH